MSRRDALDFARRDTALHFYATKGVSLGYCAQIVGMDKEDLMDDNAAKVSLAQRGCHTAALRYD